MFVIEDGIRAENVKDVLRGYYNLLVKMNRMSRISLSEPEFTLTPTRWVDKMDGNLTDAIHIVKEINMDDTLRVLNLYGESGELMAMARFRETPESHELHIGDIIPIADVSNMEEVYASIIRELMQHAKEFDLENMFLEVPLADGTLKIAATALGFVYNDKDNQDKVRFRTIILRRNALEEFKEDTYGRYRTNKQTVPYNE